MQCFGKFKTNGLDACFLWQAIWVIARKRVPKRDPIHQMNCTDRQIMPFNNVVTKFETYAMYSQFGWKNSFFDFVFNSGCFVVHNLNEQNSIIFQFTRITHGIWQSKCANSHIIIQLKWDEHLVLTTMMTTTTHGLIS